MKEITKKMIKEYHQAKPFKHLIIDDFFKEIDFSEIVRCWPTKDRWMNHDHHNTKKEILRNRIKLKFGIRPRSIIGDYVYIINIDFAEEIRKLFDCQIYCDHSLQGAGLHQHQNNGFLNTHTDFNIIDYQDFKIQRCLNIIFYVHPEWKKEWGGQTSIGYNKEKLIEAKPNRILIFEASEKSWHGCELVTCPENVQRRTIAAYFYKEAEAGISQHSTRYKK